MHVSVCVCTRAHTRTHTLTQTHTSAHTYTHTHMQQEELGHVNSSMDIEMLTYCIKTCKHTHTQYIYIYIERERERERNMYIHIYACTCKCSKKSWGTIKSSQDINMLTSQLIFDELQVSECVCACAC